MREGHTCVVYDVNPDTVAELVADGAVGASSLEELAQKMTAPRSVWIMVPAGKITEDTVNAVADQLESGDAIIDGGNSYYHDDIRRSAALAERGIDYIDCGTSGGVFGLERGFCLMIGGPDGAVERLDPIFATIAPGVATAERTPGRSGDPSTAENGYLHCGPAGAGHFVKMVHNGIEYGIMAAFAEGLNILKNADAGKLDREADAETAPLDRPELYQYDMDIPEITELWRRGSVVGLVAPGPHGDCAHRVTRALGVRRKGLGLGRGSLDVDRGHRRGRAGAGAHDRAVLALPVPQPRRLREQGALGHAQAVRRARREKGVAAGGKRPVLGAYRTPNSGQRRCGS